GVVIGAAAGFNGGWIDAVLMRFTDGMLAVPAFFFILVVITVLGTGVATLVFVIGALSWMPVARVVYGETLRWKAAEFVLAARSLAIYPGAAITAVVLAFNFVGDGLRDALDPRRRR